MSESTLHRTRSTSLKSPSKLELQPDRKALQNLLLLPDPKLNLEVVLLDRPCALSESQFDALLIESQCEV